MDRKDIFDYNSYIGLLRKIWDKRELIIVEGKHSRLGHVDIEYEWYLMKAKKKVPIPNKYVNEVLSGRICSNLQDKVYLSQIIKNILNMEHGVYL
jgi:hypothetical protein